jgi:hypothetical protein
VHALKKNCDQSKSKKPKSKHGHAYPRKEHQAKRPRTHERQKRAPSAHSRTNVRREHQAHCAHPAVGITGTSTEPGGLARPRKTICKLKRFVNDLKRTTDIAYGLRSLWSRSSHRALPEFLQALPGTSWPSTEESRLRLSVSCV